MDEARRGAPEPEIVDLDHVLRGFAATHAAAAWAGACAFISRTYKLPVKAEVNEIKDVHPVIGCVLLAIVQPRGDLRLWRDEEAPDDLAGKRVPHMWPDFALTDARDSMLSTFGARILVEVKLPRRIHDASYQARSFMRRRVYQLVREADARGEALDGITVFGVGTDGAHIVIIRMESGAPPAGRSFRGMQPCPVWQTPPLPLFPDWDGRTQPTPPGAYASEAPAGFRALHRLCTAPAHLLGVGGPLADLRVSAWHGYDAVDAGGGPPGGPPVSVAASTRLSQTLAFKERIGCGGTSDVYSCASGSGDDGNACAGGGLVVKVARYSTERVVNEFAAERAVLSALRGSAAIDRLVPTLVAAGERERVLNASRDDVGVGSVATLRWPVLALRPHGMPLHAWVSARAHAAVARCDAATPDSAPSATLAAAAAASHARVTAADDVVRRVLRAVAAAHAVGYVHCDVRPSNIVIFNNTATLIDWGAARATRAHVRHCGVAAYSDARIFSDAGAIATPRVDALGALFTWLAIACGSGSCAPPWLVSDSQRIDTDELMFLERARWLEQVSSHALQASSAVALVEQRVAAVAMAVRTLERTDGSKARSRDASVAVALRALTNLRKKTRAAQV